jgi:hypothetical protein
MVWLPSMLSTISVLSNLAIVYIPMECPTPKMMVTACSSRIKTHCVYKSVSSYTETYLSGLSSCTLYTFSLDIQNTSIWSMQSNTAGYLQVSKNGSRKVHARYGSQFTCRPGMPVTMDDLFVSLASVPPKRS